MPRTLFCRACGRRYTDTGWRGGDRCPNNDIPNGCDGFLREDVRARDLDQATYASRDDAISDVLEAAYQFDNKPHLLFSTIIRLSRTYGSSPSYHREVECLMTLAYERIASHPEVWGSPQACWEGEVERRRRTR
jgi:hypothetical protein